MKSSMERPLYCLLLTALLFLYSGCVSMMIDVHFKSDCGSCHTGRAEYGHPNLINPGNPSLTCRRCHDYRNDEDHHPIKASSDIRNKIAMNNLPFDVSSGKMACLTCHEIHAANDYLQRSQGLLKGGPYENIRDECFGCHDREAYSSINPHNSMIDIENELDKRTCLFCHSEAPDPEVDRTEDVRFRASIYFLCWRCHQCSEEELLKSHFLRQSKIEVGRSFDSFEEMRKNDAYIGLGQASDSFLDMEKNAASMELILPLDPQGRMTCSTCHNPHQPGVMFDERAKKGAGVEKRLRYKERCVVCHSK